MDFHEVKDINYIFYWTGYNSGVWNLRPFHKLMAMHYLSFHVVRTYYSELYVKLLSSQDLLTKWKLQEAFIFIDSFLLTLLHVKRSKLSQLQVGEYNGTHTIRLDHVGCWFNQQTKHTYLKKVQILRRCDLLYLLKICTFLRWTQGRFCKNHEYVEPSICVYTEWEPWIH